MKSSKILRVNSLDKLPKYGISDIVVAIGVFDGLHLGHRKIIDTLLELSERLKCDPVIVTFFPHPRKVLNLQPDIRFLISPDAKAAILEKLGIRAVVTVPFTKSFAKLSHKEFMRNVIGIKSLNVKGLCVGSGWRFGANGKGDRKYLEKLSAEKFVFKPVDELHLNSLPVSSTMIRKAVYRGDFKYAEMMLGGNCIMDAEIFSKSSTQTSGEDFYCKMEFGILPPAGIYSGSIANQGGEYFTEIRVADSEKLIFHFTADSSKQYSLKDKIKVQFNYRLESEE